MHPENLTAIASADADAPGLEQPDGEQPEIAETLGDALPHAANPIPTATRAASSAADRQRRPPLLDVANDSCSTTSTPTSIHRSSTCWQPTYSACISPGQPPLTARLIAAGVSRPWVTLVQARPALSTAG